MTAKVELEANLAAAQERLSRVTGEEGDALNFVRQRFAPLVGGARRDFANAEAAMRDWTSANASHPWEGKRVQKLVNRRPYGWPSEFKKDVVYGVVEVCRVDTAFIPNTSPYNTPTVGEAFVRLLKKDGTIGSRHERRITIGGISSDWKLEESAL